LELVEIEMIDLLNEFGFDGDQTPIVKGKVQTVLLDYIEFEKSSLYS
jgi:translation elongation factor EF-Tu-like GTPase